MSAVGLRQESRTAVSRPFVESFLTSIGFLLQLNRELASSPGLIATMIVILVIGIAVDSVIFGTIDRAIRRRGGLPEANR